MHRHYSSSLRSDAVAAAAFFLAATTVLLPALQRWRANARSEACMARLKNVALACTTYHTAFSKLPFGAGGTQGTKPSDGNDLRLSGFVALLPHLQQQPLWETVSNPSRFGATTFPSMGPVPSYDPQRYVPWAASVAAFRCPDDEGLPNFDGTRNYVFCFGDGIMQAGYSESEEDRKAYARGLFTRGSQYSLEDCTDGLAVTLLASETMIGRPEGRAGGLVAKNVTGIVATRQGILERLDPSRPSYYSKDAELWPEGKGSRWADGTFRITGFTTSAFPNMGSATGNDEWTGVMSASSHHRGGVHVAMADGAVKFITDSIEAGGFYQAGISRAQNNVGAESPHGLWGAMGTRASNDKKETLQEVFGVK